MYTPSRVEPRVSFVVPFFNEERALGELHERIANVADSALSNFAWELVFVDDGSTDRSARIAAELARVHPEVRLIELQGNFGKSAALAAGFAAARGDIVFTLDADLQDDPKEIPRFLRKLEEGWDVVSGYKRQRNDRWTRVSASRIFNFMVRALTGIALHDVNCGFKAYRREVLDNVRLYGDLHRFIPVLAHWKRFKIAEIEVIHHARPYGTSKFGSGRLFRGLMDLFMVFFLLRYERRPAHFFGAMGGLFTAVGVLICGYLTVLWLGGASIGQRPLLTLGVLLVLVGVQIFGIGLIAQLLVHVASPEKAYVVRRVVGFDSSVDTRRESADEALVDVRH